MNTPGRLQAEAPWWIVPANRKWFRDVAVAQILVDVLEDMKPKYPKASVEADKIKIPE